MDMTNPRATNEDLTAKARIRNAALDLYAQYGEDGVSLRAIAAAAGVTLGVVQHHFKSKAGLRDAVDRLVVD
jgi:AcrR family transcriptional regulator